MKIHYLKKAALLLSLIVLFATACKVDEDLEIPQNKLDRMAWSYNFKNVSAYSLTNHCPAIDPSDNIYASVAVQSGVDFIKLNAAGKELWKTHTSESVSSQMVYYNQKVFVIVGGKLMCMDSSTGNLLWTKDQKTMMNVLAVNQNTIYTFRVEDNGLSGKYYLVSYDLSGNKNWEQPLQCGQSSFNPIPEVLSVDGGFVYIGAQIEAGDKNFIVFLYDDQGTTGQKVWKWLAPDNYSIGGSSPKIKDFAIDENGSLLFGMEKGSSQSVFSVTNLGATEWTTESNVVKIISSVSVDGVGDAYVNYDFCESLNNNGSNWESSLKPDWDYKGLYSRSPIIDLDGNLIYVNESSILTSVKPNGDFMWEQYLDQVELNNDVFQNISMLHNGDIILISKGGIMRIKGNGKGLNNAGWPKQYSDYANTASR